MTGRESSQKDKVAGVSSPRLADKQSTALVTDLGSLILTARSCEDDHPPSSKPSARVGAEGQPSLTRELEKGSLLAINDEVCIRKTVYPWP